MNESNQSLSKTSIPIWNQPLSWVMLIPILFYATNGNVIPEAGDVAFRAAEATGSSMSHRVSVGLVTVLCTWLIFTRLPTVFQIVQRSKLLIALPVLTLLSCVWSQNSSQTMVSGSILCVFTLFAFFVSTTFATSRQLDLLMFAGGVALLLSVTLAVFAPTFGAAGGSWRGIFAHKQNCAAASTLLLVTALHWKCSGSGQHLFRAVYALLCCVMIVMSQSRTGWALAVLALSLSVSFWLLQKMPPREGILTSFLVAGLFGGLGYAVIANASVLLPAVGKDATLSERTIIWAAAWTTIAKHPMLGYGYGAFWNGLQGASLNIVLISGWVLAQAQNGFLDLWLQAGVGCIVLVALITLQAVWNALHCFRGSGQDAYVRWCIVTILCTLVYNIGESSLGMIHLVWFLFLLACIGLKEIARTPLKESAMENQQVSFSVAQGSHA